MPSVLLFQANEINQKISNIQLPILPIKWSNVRKQWIIVNQQKRINYFIFSFIWKIMAIVILALTLGLIVKYPGFAQVEQIFVCIVCLQIAIGTLITDIFILMFGEEMVGCCNWCYKTENIWSRHSMDFLFSSKYTQVRSRWAFCFKKVDPVGGLTLTFSLFLTLFSCLATTFVIILNWEPMSLLIHLLKNTVFLSYSSKSWFQVVVKVSQIISYGYAFLLSNWMLVNIRTLFILQLTSGTSFVGLESILLKSSQNRLSDCILLCKQLTIERNTLLSFEKAAITGFLTVIFFLTVLSVGAIEVRILYGSPMISITSTSIVLVVIAVLVVTLNLCCLIYEKSVKIRSLWKWRILQEYNTKYFGKVMKSLKPLNVPAGNMGKVDQEMKMNYSHAVLVNTVNFLVGLGEFIAVMARSLALSIVQYFTSN